MRYPVVGLCIAFCLGILFSSYLKIPFLIFYLLAFLFLILSFIFLKDNLKFSISILCAAFFLGSALLKNSHLLSKNHICHFTPYRSKIVSVKGVIDSDPIMGERKTTFILKAEELISHKVQKKVCGKILVSVFKDENFSYGEELILVGALYKPPHFYISEKLNYRDYLYRQNIYSLLSVGKNNRVIRPGINRGNLIKRIAFLIKHRIRKIISENLSPLSGSILKALLLGERKDFPKFINQQLIRSNTIHILAVSGLHVGIVAFIFLVFLKSIGIKRRWRYLIVIFLLITYAILTGARPPAVRATTMAVIFFSGYLLRRIANLYNSLAIAALIILGANPNQLFEMGFQLSFMSVIFIVWLFPKIRSLFGKKLLNIKLLSFLISAFSVSIAAWMGTLGLVMYYFEIFSPIAILANTIIVPYMLIVVASGLTFVFIGMLIPALVPIFRASCEFFIWLLMRTNSLLLNIPAAYFELSKISFVYPLLYYILIVLIFNLSKIFKK